MMTAQFTTDKSYVNLTVISLILNRLIPFPSNYKPVRSSNKFVRYSALQGLFPVKCSSNLVTTAKEYKYYKKVHLLFGLFKNVLRRILLPPCSQR